MNIGLIAVATPRNGGTFQYTLSMIEALHHLSGHRITIYTDTEHSYYRSLGFKTRSFVRSRLRQVVDVVADVLHVRFHEPFGDEEVLIAPTYATALLHTRKPFAFTLHDLQERYYPENFSWLQRRWRGLLNSRSTKRATRIVCESTYVKRDICRFFDFAAEKVVVIAAPPLPVRPIAAASTAFDVFKSRVALPNRFIFYPAQFWPHKNHRKLIEAFVQIASVDTEVILLLTGRPGVEHASVSAQIDGLGLASRVRRLGYLTQDEIQMLYANAALLVMPSLFESVSIPVYEAQQAGIPVAASKILALPEQVGDGGVLFDPLSATAIASAVLSVLQNPADARRMGEAGRRQVAMMTFERYGSQIEAVVASLVSGRG